MSTAAPDSFDRLQSRLSTLGPRALSDLTEGCIVVLPSLTFPPEELRKISGIGRYEERLLCMLLLLRAPALEMVFVSSLRVEPIVIDYYLSFLDDPEGAHSRLTMVALDDDAPRALSEKLLDRTDVLAHLRRLVDGKDAYLLPFNVTAAERAVATSVGAPLYGPRPGLAYAGSKSGSRHIAMEAGVPVLPGREDLHSMQAVDDALRALIAEHPDHAAAVVKLNYGFSGQGNAVVELSRWAGSAMATDTTFCAAEESWASFATKITQDGGIVEAMVRHPAMLSPSVQMRIATDGSVEIVSTHDQILGGPDDQVYLGCRFPAGAAYRTEIQEAGSRIAKVLATKGVVGSFGVDFVIVPGPDGPDIYLSEINLRLGGTSHPFYMARFATGGTYEPRTGELVVDGAPRSYVATDNPKSEAYRRLTPGGLLDELGARGLAFDPAAKEGVAIHLLGAMAEYGKLGATCIAGTPEGAEALYERLVATLDHLAGP